MQCSPIQLKEKLLNALDQDQNVIDMPSVLQVITSLETYPITKDALEQTRIGKFVNDMRRKTNDRDLARRAKNLVRKWKELIEQQQQQQNSNTVNGEGLAGSATNGSSAGMVASIPDHLRHIASSGSKPASPASGPGTPSSGRSNISPNLSGRVSAMGSRPGTPLSRQSSPRLSRPTTPSGANSEQSHNNNIPHCSAKHPKSGARIVSPLSHFSNASTTSSSNLSKTNVANKRKRRQRDEEHNVTPAKKSSDVSDINSDKLNGVVPGWHSHIVDTNSNSCDKTPFNNMSFDISKHAKATTVDSVTKLNSHKQQQKSVSPPGLTPKRNASAPSRIQDQDKVLHKTPKVKTTAELIREMSASSDLQVAGSKTATKIVRNQIHKERDDIDTPVVPPEAKPRFRRKPGTSAIIPPDGHGHSLSQAKNEMMEKFLQSQSPNPSVEDAVSANEQFLMREEDDEPRHRESCFDGDGLVDNKKVSFFVGDDVIQSAESVSQSAKKTENKGDSSEVDPWSLLPPLNLAEIDWTTDSYTEIKSKSVTESDLEKIEKEQLEGINGQYDNNEKWHEWTDTQSRPSYSGDLLHVLPYINIDDF